jgi:hypothetical protein
VTLVCSIFPQILQLIPRLEFESAVRQHNAERHARGFTMLMVKYLQLRSTFGWSLSNLVALLRQQLFVYRDLWAWIDDPFQPPPIPERPSEQLRLQLI